MLSYTKLKLYVIKYIHIHVTERFDLNDASMELIDCIWHTSVHLWKKKNMEMQKEITSCSL